MQKRDQVATFAGNPVVLVGDEVKVGQPAPEFIALKEDLSEFSLSELKGKNVLISVVPSIDTGVCEAQTRRFNEEASKLENTVIITISVDLPFAQKRFCAAEGIENLIMLSDYRHLDFAHKYGFELEGLRLLSRGIVGIDKEGVIRYVEYTPEVTNHPDYDKALAAVKAF
ncbi:thiol peroxidase [Clostridiales bacterium COT073_COT-073]|nr:thiol peroxidase [Clostridiales bacterium COT073_COT-073]